jgi:hypothetical protein
MIDIETRRMLFAFTPLSRDPHPEGPACWLHEADACLSLE